MGNKAQLASFAISAAVAAFVAAPLGVSAGGAQVQHILDKGEPVCVETKDQVFNYYDAVICTQDEGVWTQVTTSSGNVNLSFNGTYTFTEEWYDGGVQVANYSRTVNTHRKKLFKAGEPHVIKDRVSEVVDLDSQIFGCHITTVESDYQLVNGEVLKDNVSTTMEEC